MPVLLAVILLLLFFAVSLFFLLGKPKTMHPWLRRSLGIINALLVLLIVLYLALTMLLLEGVR